MMELKASRQKAATSPADGERGDPTANHGSKGWPGHLDRVLLGMRSA